MQVGLYVIMKDVLYWTHKNIDFLHSKTKRN